MLPNIHHVRKGSPPSSRHQNGLIDRVNHLSQYHPEQTLALFEVTDGLRFPGRSGVAGTTTMPPWCTGKRVRESWYDQAINAEYTDLEETLYFPQGARSDSGEYLVEYPIGVDEWWWCAWEQERNRWEVIYLPQEGTSSSSGSGSGSEGSGSQVTPSQSEGPPQSGSAKDTAIVRASWTKGGYAGLSVLECPEVRFDDVIVVTIQRRNQGIQIDPRYLEVCEPGSVEVCGCVPDMPVLVGASVEGAMVRVRFTEDWPQEEVRLVIRLTGIRKHFARWRFPDCTKEDFDRNEARINALNAWSRKR